MSSDMAKDFNELAERLDRTEKALRDMVYAFDHAVDDRPWSQPLDLQQRALIAAREVLARAT